MHLGLEELEALGGRAGQRHVDRPLVTGDAPGREQGLDFRSERARVLVDAPPTNETPGRRDQQVGIGARRWTEGVLPFRRRSIAAPVTALVRDLSGVIPMPAGIERRPGQLLHPAPPRSV